MRSEQEIRQYRDDLRVLHAVPCNCAETGHAYECQQGSVMMEADIRVLSWILGEGDARHEKWVAMAREAAAAERAAQN